MTKIRSTLFALAVAASATVVATAGAQSSAPVNGQRIERSQSDSTQWKGRAGKGRGMRGQMGPGRAAFRGVKPTDAQKAQIKAIHQKYQAQFKSIHEAMKPAIDEAKAARQRGDTTAARAAFAKTADSRQQAQALRAQEVAEIRAILTPEQQKTFDANVAQMKTRGEHGRGEHAGKGRGNRSAS
jgi:Spy/CpxP family protein refolding chaperone